MPTYEFRCPDGSIIERFFKISEVPSEIPAPDGSGMAVRVISGGAGLIFKGSGFYITDYGKDGKKDQRAASSPSADRDSASGSSGGASSSGATSSGSSASTPASGASSPATSSSPGSAKPSGGE
ncbi:MAG: hypothetical protein ABS52_12255 [Gemmatimonadetes bacterium SCN 70-22]|nr:MAG: hypothetical protein ABS52_12255 [Gemmatimonadetes bacterium SCN 70-22]